MTIDGGAAACVVVSASDTWLVCHAFFRWNPTPWCCRFTDEAARERKKLDTEVAETEEMKAKRLEKAVRQETIKEQVQVRPGEGRWLVRV